LYFMKYFHDNAASFSSAADISTVISEFITISADLLKNKEIYVVLVAFVIGIGIVFFLSRLSFNHCWTVSVITGFIIVSVICILGARFTGTTDTKQELIRILLSLPVILVYEFLFYAVDYRSTEHLQFEDDEYYYYVKAVPKITMDRELSRKE